MPAKILLIIIMVLALPLVGTLFGAFTGWVVGLFFADTVFTFLIAIGMDVSNLTMWQIGAALGFLGSFFRTTVTK